MTVSKQYVIDRFNTIVKSYITSFAQFSSATNYAGSVPVNGSFSGHADLGPRAETNFTTGNIPGDYVSSNIFNILHNFAMEYTRVRQANLAYFVNVSYTNTSNYSQNIGRTALRADFALYFPIPAGAPNAGQTITAAQIDSFLASLRDAVYQRRTSSSYAHTLFSCHSNCHTSCHGSRGRR